MAEPVGTPTDNALSEHADREAQLADPSGHADQARARELGRRDAEPGVPPTELEALRHEVESLRRELAGLRPPKKA